MTRQEWMGDGYITDTNRLACRNCLAFTSMELYGIEQYKRDPNTIELLFHCSGCDTYLMWEFKQLPTGEVEISYYVHLDY